MASPEAKHRMLEREARRLRIIAASAGTSEELERYEETRNQPTYGDPDMARIFEQRALADLLQDALDVEIEEDELSEEGQLYQYNHLTGESEPYKSSLEQSQEEEAVQGQPLDDDPKPGDEIDAPSDEEVEESYDEGDVIPGTREAHDVSATPAAKAKAEELGVDLTQVNGTGNGGRIVSADVERATKDDSGEDDSEEDNSEEQPA
jgi:pyruvate/2-oxoglutarate dehydrogenase complex dihydrolipoamide acyltransferase (E2) component